MDRLSMRSVIGRRSNRVHRYTTPDELINSRSIFTKMKAYPLWVKVHFIVTEDISRIELKTKYGEFKLPFNGFK